MSPKASLIIVDGYNILNAWGMIRDRINLEAARMDLAHLLADFAGYRGEDIALVFDAHQLDTVGTETQIGSLTLMFTKAGETADSRIEGMVKPMREQYGRVTVVTADYTLQLFALGAGGIRMTPTELKLQVEAERGRPIE